MNSTQQYLDGWLADGRISADQHGHLSALASRRRISLFLELNALLYLGVLSLSGGLAWIAREYSAEWGDAAILGPATILLVGCFSYCFTRVPPYSRERVEAPGLAFDYILYLGCLTFAVELGYVEYRFGLLSARWDYYLLASAALYLVVAYRFDNRFVLSLAVATLGAWFNVRLSRLGFLDVGQTRTAALVYGGAVALLGFSTYRGGVKKHFLETYAHISVNVILAALASGVISSRSPSMWSAGLLAGAAGSVVGGVRYRRFAFVVYGVVYGYIGLLRELLRGVDDVTAALGLVLVSSATVIVGLVVLSRRLGAQE